MDMTVGFSRLERPRNHLGRHSNCSRRMFYGGENGLGLSKSHCEWLLPFYTYPAANCLALYLLSSMVFTTTVCQVYVSGSVGTEVQWLCQWWFKLRSGMRITLQSIDEGLCLPVNAFMGQEGKCQPA